MTDPITMDTARRLAARAGDGDPAALREFAALARKAGYAGRAGGWIYDTTKPHGKGLAQGWQTLASQVRQPHVIGRRNPAYAEVAYRIMRLMENAVPPA